MELHLGHQIQWNVVDKKCVTTCNVPLKDSLNKDDAIEVVQGFIKVSRIKDGAIKARSQINAATGSEI